MLIEEYFVHLERTFASCPDVEVSLPGSMVTWEERMKLAEVAADLEEKYDVYIGILTHPEAA